MRVNLEGLLRGVVNCHPADRSLKRFTLEELLKHLRELRDRHMAGDGAAALDEFFGSFVFGKEPTPAEARERLEAAP